MDPIDSVKAWVWGVIGAPLITLLLWYFRRSASTVDKRLEKLEEELDGMGRVLALKVDKTDMGPLWEKLALQDQDIKALGAAFSRELREQIDSLRRESNEHQRQTNERLDRILTLMATGALNEHSR